MLSLISSMVACMVSMPPWRSMGGVPVQSGLNDPADLPVLERLVGAVHAGSHPAVEGATGPGERFGELGKGGAQGPGDVEAGALGGRRRHPVPAAEAERAGQLPHQTVQLVAPGLGLLEAPGPKGV